MLTKRRNSADALDLATHAAHAGASALMVVPPFYDPLTVPQLHEYFADIHAAAPHLALMYYNIPGASGVALSPAELAGLRAAGVTHLKDTSGNGPALTELLFGLQDEITAFNGWDTLTFYALCAGAKGGIWGATNVIPELSMRLWDAVAVRGDLGEGRRVWAKIWPVCKFFETHMYHAAVKTAMELRGFRTGGVRKPFKLLEGAEREELAGLLRAAGVEVVV